MTPDERLIVALDAPTVSKAENIIEALGASVSFYKIGYQLIPIGGLDLANRLSAAKKKVFLDFKFHDIGATVERGVVSIRRAGCDFLTVHAERDTLLGAVRGRADDARLKIFGVTVLTSIDQAALTQSGIEMAVTDLVLRRAELAVECGADGIIASAKEAGSIKQRFGDDLLVVTPGIRPAGGSPDDQKRVVSPSKALNNGADYLVVGRPIIAAENPKAAADAIIAEMNGKRVSA